MFNAIFFEVIENISLPLKLLVVGKIEEALPSLLKPGCKK